MFEQLSNFIEIASGSGIKDKFTPIVLESIERLGFKRPLFKRMCAITEVKSPDIKRPLNAMNRLESYLKTIDHRLRVCHVAGKAGNNTYSKIIICLAGDEKKATKSALDFVIGGA